MLFVVPMLYPNKKAEAKPRLSPFVLETGLEPVRTNVHWILSPTCLPIPPLELACRGHGLGISRKIFALQKKTLTSSVFRAKKGIRTLDPHLGKVMLYP